VPFKHPTNEYESPDDEAFNAPTKKMDMMPTETKCDYAKVHGTPLKFEHSPFST